MSKETEKKVDRVFKQRRVNAKKFSFPRRIPKQGHYSIIKIK